MHGKGQLQRRFNIEANLAVVTAALVVLTLINHEWIAVLTGWDPDKGTAPWNGPSSSSSWPHASLFPFALAPTGGRFR